MPLDAYPAGGATEREWPKNRVRSAAWFDWTHGTSVVLAQGPTVSARDAAAFRHLGTIIRTARLRLGYTQRHLERLSGVDQTTISRLENGRLTSLRLVRLAAIFLALTGGLSAASAA